MLVPIVPAIAAVIMEIVLHSLPVCPNAKKKENEDSSFLLAASLILVIMEIIFESFVRLCLRVQISNFLILIVPL
jgi:hypothetical protein